MNLYYSDEERSSSNRGNESQPENIPTCSTAEAKDAGAAG